ncbi:MAG: TIGR03668 family PPOX class F420-dependent oxidoreductase [Chloroflexi bacterium]|nr:TIGR03668 family PPOX class F420-dependent oxidoreductase [Chloroflexota bacterium]
MDVESFIHSHRVARLATITPDGKPHIVPVVYAYDGAHIFIALDEKPKRVAPMQLQRVRNIDANPDASLIVDDYDEAWARLAWVRLDGVAKILQRGNDHATARTLLREKYEPYRTMNLDERPIIQITIQARAHWEAS